MSSHLPSPMAACWRQDAAHDILKVEALDQIERNDIFLATHTPITDFAVEGIGAADVVEATEAGLLAALTKPTLRHAFVTVRGEPGSGKSHLIRWLSTQWDEPGDIVVLLQRADATLRGSLEQLKQRVPEKYRSIISDISVQQERNEAGRLAEFLSGLEIALDPGNFAQQPKDADFCRTYDLSALFRAPRIKQHWAAPKRLLNVLANADGKRNSQVASFTIYDTIELQNYRADVVNISAGAERLLNAMRSEQDEVADLEDRGVPPDEAIRDHGEKFPRTRAFVQALNERRNDAIRRSLGVSAERLQEILLNLRRALLADGKRLVLLLEDITNFQGLDDRLMDALVVDARTRQDLCPLISVVGLTPSYYDNELKPNYRDRSTHKIALGRSEDGEFVDVTSFARSDVRVRFAAGYLAAVRAGRDRIGAWHDAGANGRPPNVCESCSLRPGCHSTFGAIDGVGLFPFTERSLGNFYNALKSHQKNQTARTPRGFIQGVLVPTMTRPDRLQTGHYPHADIETHEGIDRHAIMPPGLLGQHLDALPVERSERLRLQRLIMLWGDGQDPYVRDEGNSRSFAHVSEEIHHAFALPWRWVDIGAPHPHLPGVAEEPKPAERPQTSETSPEAPKEPSPSPQHNPSPPAPKPAAPNVARPANPHTQSRPRLRLSGHLETLTREAAIFRDDPSQFVPTRTIWTQVVVEMVTNADMVDYDRLDLDREMFKDIFRDNLIKIAGMDPGSRSERHFVLPKDAWVIDGIVAYGFTRDRAAFTSLDMIDQSLRLRQLANFIRRLHPLMREHIRKRLPKVDGKPQNLPEAVACTLAARAWLRGEIAPTASLTDQLQAIFRDEREATTSPNSRVESWQKALSSTHATHQALRASLKEALLLRQGKGADGPLDVAATFTALKTMQRTLNPPIADEEQDLDTASSPYRRAMTTTNDLQRRLQVIQREEPERIAKECKALDLALHKVGIAERLRTFNTVIQEADGKLPLGQNPPSVHDWRKAFRTLTERPSFAADCDRIEDALDDWVQTDEATLGALTRGERLARAASTPYASIVEVKAALDLAEQTAFDLSDRIAKLLEQRPDQARFDELHAFGQRIEKAAAELTQTLERIADANAA